MTASFEMVLTLIGCTFTLMTTTVALTVWLVSRITRMETELKPLLGLSDRVARIEVKVDDLRHSSEMHAIPIPAH